MCKYKNKKGTTAKLLSCHGAFSGLHRKYGPPLCFHAFLCFFRLRNNLLGVCIVVKHFFNSLIGVL